MKLPIEFNDGTTDTIHLREALACFAVMVALTTLLCLI